MKDVGVTGSGRAGNTDVTDVTDAPTEAPTEAPTAAPTQPIVTEPPQETTTLLVLGNVSLPVFWIFLGFN